jgi:hypothetical protein
LTYLTPLNVGTAVDIPSSKQSIELQTIIRDERMSHRANSVNFGVGGLAFLAGVVATIVTAYAVVSRRNGTSQKLQYNYDGWDDGAVR